MKKFAIGIVLCFCSLVFAAAKKYELKLSNPTQIGSVQLPAGEYTLKLDGSNAVFTSRDTAKSVTAPVKVETGKKKFDITSIKSSRQGETDKLESIQLGGSNTTLQFQN